MNGAKYPEPTVDMVLIIRDVNAGWLSLQHSVVKSIYNPSRRGLLNSSYPLAFA